MNKIGALINLKRDVDIFDQMEKLKSIGCECCQLCIWDMGLYTDENAEKIISAANKYNVTNVYEVDTMKDAVELAFSLSKNGDAVLLSPACASWDMFKSYEERGDLFKQLVLSL